MLQLDLIKNFLESRSVAVVGVSTHDKLPANYIYKKLKDSQYEVQQIHPTAAVVDGDPCYPAIDQAPAIPEAVVLAGPPELTEKYIPICKELGIMKVWIHRGLGAGSYSPRAEEIAVDLNLPVITNGCPMMFIGQVDIFHKILRWFKKKGKG